MHSRVGKGEWRLARKIAGCGFVGQAHLGSYNSQNPIAAETNTGSGVGRSMVKRLVLAVLTILFFALAAVTAGQAEEQFTEYRVSGNQLSATSNYWTKTRMQNAKPYPMPNPQGGPARLAQGALEQPSGPPGFDPSSKGADVSALFSKDETEGLGFSAEILEDAVNDQSDSEDETEGLGFSGLPAELSDSEGASVKATSGGYDYPPPHTTFKVLQSLYGNTSSTFPYKAIGKVFFTKAGANYVCSGASIGGRAVLTAGHCVSDGKGTYHSNWIFIPASKKNSKPYGTWSAYYFFTYAAWHNNGDNGRDVGFAVVSDQGGVKLSAKVGYLGFSYNQSRMLHWNDFGYPQAAPWDGQYLVETQASYATADTKFTPNTTGIGTTQTGGCSGGPWIMSFVPDNSGASNYVNGVNSYYYVKPDQPKQIYSPYFDTSVKAMKDAAVAK
jgi:hypothetical protein